MTQAKQRCLTVDQIGYPLNAKKSVISAGKSGTFEVIHSVTGKPVFQGETGPLQPDEAAGTAVCSGDFSALAEPGSYYVSLGDEISAPFVIADNPYKELHQGLLKAFYLFRCGCDLSEEYAGPWSHAACHLADGTVYDDPEVKLNSTGGWHDAGDYGQYTGPGAKAVADLLLAFELNPQAFRSPLPIPETDGITPDVLHECRYELEWLFKMQDDRTGGAFHKLTTKQFPALNVMPEDDLADLYFLPVSATATGCLAGVMAMASRVYRPFDEVFADRCLEAAKRAWQWLLDHPEVPGFKNPQDIGTGEYGDEQDLDERYWAAAELFRTTGDETYHTHFKALAAQQFPKYELGWADMGGYGTFAYLLQDSAKGDNALLNWLKDGLLEEADKLAAISTADGYGISLTSADYIWGSNMVVMNRAMLLLIAYHLSGNDKYEAMALDHIHYLMGRNPLDISYVTGYGDRPVMHPHHRPSVGDSVAAPVPGLVAGGPNRGLNDDCMMEHLQGKAPAECFIDDELSYAGNEVTIYWNSPAVFVVSHFVK
ncbi:glycoside hydrolase family 9 protein [Paenibacillus sp. Marseille-P2973]|uniref:glycoside hydrolase family 9 protein n=1 Tax=Paenibacillus sp. Marseille-P2973 TaxID=1871032 RepID=UPI001B393631|nr:glycoside hydrolase family 9 protein [Paenibacillus sp. Marseille-P2973]MBQ4899142.1 glycoside hydrolase family 9 protein [Paenibacillus sp. Marseille-P2973]